MYSFSKKNSELHAAYSTKSFLGKNFAAWLTTDQA